MLQASVRSGRAARRPVVFEAEATPNSAALIADSAVLVTLAFLRLSTRDGGRASLSKVGKVQFAEGKKVLYMKQDQAEKVDKISRQIGKILGFD